MNESPPPTYESALAQKLHYWYRLQALQKGTPYISDNGSRPPAMSPDYDPEFVVMEQDLPDGTTFSREEVFENDTIPTVEMFKMDEPQQEGNKKRRSRFSLRWASKKTKKLAKRASRRFQKFEREHRVLEKTRRMARETSQKCKETANGAAERMREYNEKHHVSHKTRSLFSGAASYVHRSFSSKRN